MQFKIQAIKDPFPHVIIENFYNNDELKVIWDEIDKLFSSYQFLPATFGGSFDNNHLSCVLDKVYQNKEESNILRINRKAFSKEILDAFVSLNPLLAHIYLCNKDITKLKYYQNYNHYNKHQDLYRFTILTYFYKEPKLFNGGNLHFDDFNYTIEIKNNMLVLFMGSIFHSSLPVQLEGKDLSGMGKYTMAQFLDINLND